jgi:hypothetical protein
MLRNLFLCVFVLALGVSSAEADEWTYRTGSCYDWDGRWTVNEEAGVWIGLIDLEHIGGPCLQSTGQRVTHQVRAVIAGKDFFAYRTSGSFACYLHGQLRNEGVTGFELCQGGMPLPFALRFSPPREREQR